MTRYFFFAAFFTAFFFAGAFLAAFLVAICLFSLFDGLHRFCNKESAVDECIRVSLHQCQEKNDMTVEKRSTLFPRLFDVQFADLDNLAKFLLVHR